MSEITYPVFRHFDPTAIARRALIFANPLYMALGVAEQAHYRVSRSEMDDKKIINRIEKDVLDYVNAHFETFPVIPNCEDQEEQVDEIKTFLENWVSLLANNGVGNPIWFNEFNVVESDFLKAEFTLDDYHLGQVKIQHELSDEDDRVRQEYSFMHWSAWIRFIKDSKFYYGTISSVSGYVLSQVDLYVDDIIDELIPHDYVEAVDHGKETKGGIIWDFKLDAGGKEPQFEELRDRWSEKYNQLNDELEARQEKLPPKTFIKFKFNNDSLIDPHIDIVVNNASAAKQLNLSRFADDAEKSKADFNEIEKLITQEKTKAKTFLENQYNEIEENFDPTIVKFKQKMKVVIAPGALDGLE